MQRERSSWIASPTHIDGHMRSLRADSSLACQRKRRHAELASQGKPMGTSRTTCKLGSRVQPRFRLDRLNRQHPLHTGDTGPADAHLASAVYAHMNSPVAADTAPL